MKPLAINCRFLNRSMTGVDRFAGELLRALDRLQANGDPLLEGLRVRALAPPGTARPPWLEGIPLRTCGRLRGQAWEQLELPRAAGDDLLLNLCNTGPLLRRRQLVVIHDVATFRVPQSYSATFRRWYGLMTPRLYRAAAQVATVSEFSRREMAGLFGKRDDVVVLPEGADHIGRGTEDTAILDRYALRARPFALAVSSQAPHKNFSVVAEAVAQIRGADFDLVVAGGQNPKVFGGGRPLPGFVKHVGYVTDAELLALYRNAACFVFPSRYEGFGLPAVEAMACGCPVLAANAASIPEVCGEAALYFDPQDAPTLARVLSGLMADEAQRRRRSAAGRAHVEGLKWENAAKCLLEMIAPT